MAALTTDNLRALVRAVGVMDAVVDDAERIDRLRLFEELKSAACAAQAATAVDLDRSQRVEQEAIAAPGPLSDAERSRGVAAQIALAMRISPWKAQRFLGWAKILTSELPATYRELQAGRTSEWRAVLVARETAVLTREHRMMVDAAIAPHLPDWGDRRVDHETRAMAYRLDPAAAVARTRIAESQRRVTLRPAPDTMTLLTAVLPVAQGVAAYAALIREADRLTGIGDARNRGQLMADTLTERLTGQATATAVPVEINLIMTDQALLENTADAALIDGYGPVPTTWARDLALDNSGSGARWIRRLYTDRARLTGVESRRRCFNPGQQHYVRLRDQFCRTPWCNAPIRHIDHITPHSRGGPTHLTNSQGLCQACNHARQAPGWCARFVDGNLIIRTPTGHSYASREPVLPGRTNPTRRSDAA